MPHRPWTRDELIVAFNLYCKLRFGQCHGGNPQVKAIAKALGRTPGAVAMKLCNFASFDPSHQRRGVSGLGNASRADGEIWDEFNANWNGLAVQSEKAARQLLGNTVAETSEDLSPDATEPASPEVRQTESQRLQNVRLGQAFFRSTVLASYKGQCCMCQLSCRCLLVASHIVPWAANPSLRLDPRNGLCLCAMHDRAFDRGLVTVDGEFKVVVSGRLEGFLPHRVVEVMFMGLQNQPIQLPEKFRPKPEHLDYHRTSIYQAV